MAIFEVFMFVFSGILLILFLSERKMNHQVVRLMVVLSVLTLLFHLVFGFVRWQFYPLYMLLFLSLLLLINKLYHLFSLKKYFLISLNVFFIVAFILSLFAVLSFPIYDIPNPTGEYEIGTTYYVIQDSTREELYSEETYRRIMIQLWYPAETTEGYERAPWLEGGQILSRALARDNYLPAFALDHSIEVMSNSYYGAPMNEDLDRYPVIILSHGWRGFRTLHTDFAEELASHGYIVVSIDHTYGSVATVFDTNDVAYLNLDALPPRESNPNFLEDANQLVNTYSQDIITTLNYLETINTQETILNEQLDLNTVGLLGHSTGGGAGVETALNDSRVDALFGLDSWVEPIGHDQLTQGLSIPSVFLRSESWETGENNAYLYNLIENSSFESHLYQVNGTTHLDFSMVYMYSPLTKYIGFTGTIDSAELTQILKTMILEFFNTTLVQQTDEDIDINRWEQIVNVEIP